MIRFHKNDFFVFAVSVSACVGGSERPCHGNGMCDGDGTRGGNGQCSCVHGYKGEFCLDCIDGYFNEVRNDTFSLCKGTVQSTQIETERTATIKNKKGNYLLCHF